MMLSHYFKVGLGILAAVAIVVVSYQQLKEKPYTDENSYILRVEFDNIQGLTAGNDVWLSGVKIGSVEKITLRPDGRAMLTLRVINDNKILVGSSFTINASFLQDKNLSIEKPEFIKKPYKYYQPNTTIKKTTSPASVPDIMNEAENALKQLNGILAEVRVVVADDRMKENIFDTAKNIEMATAQAYEFVKLLKDTGMANRENIDATLANIRTLSESLNDTITKVDALIEHADQIVGDQETKQQIKEIVASLRTSAENVEKTTDAIKDIATDEEIHEELKETIKSTRNTMEHADKAVRGFTKMMDAINKTEFKPDFEFRYETRADLFHADMNVRVFPPSSENFYLFGFDNLGDDKTTNLQFGVKGGWPDSWYRLGIKNGNLGMGIEMKKRDLIYYGDLSDPNELHLDLRAGKEINKNQYVIMGWEGIFDNDGLSIGFLQKY